MFAWLRQLPGLSGVRKPGAAVLVLAALVGAAFGTGAAMIEITGSARESGGLPTATTVAEAAPPTTVAQESGFWTAVIASVPIDGNADAQTAQAVARAADGGHEAFVLDGREYENINDGFLAVCIGRFEAEDEAAALVDELDQAGFQPQPFTRNVGDLTGGGGEDQSADASGDGDGEDGGDG